MSPLFYRIIPIVLSLCFLCFSAVTYYREEAACSAKCTSLDIGESITAKSPLSQRVTVADLPQPVKFLSLGLHNHDNAEGKRGLFSQNLEKEHAGITLLHVESVQSSYRLCGYAGGPGLWVVSVEDENGHYFTVRDGETLPMSGMLFKGISFRVVANNVAPEPVALFVNKDEGRSVEVCRRGYGGGNEGGERALACIIAVPNGGSRRVCQGETFTALGLQWTARTISVTPPKVTLINEQGAIINLTGSEGSLSQIGAEPAQPVKDFNFHGQ